jgi:anti-sigma B factor antagonist
MGLEIAQERRGSVHVLALSGRLDTETSTDLELAVQDLLNAGERHFVLDLSNIGYVSSAGLRVLLATAKQLDGGKGTLRLCGLNAAVKQVFDVAGFSKLFSIYSTQTAALEKHPAAKPDAQLARNVAQLMGAGGAAPSSANPKAGEIARSAAELLGAKPSTAAVEKSKPKTPPPPPRTAVKRPAEPEKPGLLGKLKGLFGGK